MACNKLPDSEEALEQCLDHIKQALRYSRLIDADVAYSGLSSAVEGAEMLAERLRNIRGRA